MIGPNLLHIVLLGFAVICAYFTLGEMNRRSLRRQRLFARAVRGKDLSGLGGSGIEIVERRPLLR